MVNYLKKHEVVLQTVGPVYVGDGKNLNKKEYIFLRREKKVLIPDDALMYQELEKKGLGEKFADYFLNGNNALNQWLYENNIRTETYSKWIKYELDCGDFLMNKGPIQIQTFQKDAYGLPYIPGTSMKGMLRTILLAWELQKNNNLARRERTSLLKESEKFARKKEYLLYESKNIEQAAFHTLHRKNEKGEEIKSNYAVNDMLSGLIVSDSEPISLEDMTLCQKIDVNTKGEAHSLNILRESVMPGKEIRFHITIDSSLCSYTIEDIMEAIKVFGELYFSMYLSCFPGTASPPQNTVWLGGGSGFFTKTVLYPLLGKQNGVIVASNVFKNTLSDKINRQHKHDRDKSLGVSPHILKCTQFNGKKYQVGMCRILVL